MPIFCFDRDRTIDVNNGPVSLETVKLLSKRYDVWAIGNQKLKEEANIKGISEAKEEANEKGIVVKGLDTNTSHAGLPSRKNRLKLVEKLYDIHKEGNFEYLFVHIDDVDVGAGNWEHWEYYYPEDFVDSVHAKMVE